MENANKVAIGCDHTAVDFKNQLIAYMEELGYAVTDCGSYDTDGADDYPDVAVETCGKVVSGQCRTAVLICGTGIGMSMAANKMDGIRAALCSDYYSVKYTRRHNDANVICFGARVMGIELAKELLGVFLVTEFDGGRHQRRIDKINCIGK